MWHGVFNFKSTGIKFELVFHYRVPIFRFGLRDLIYQDYSPSIKTCNCSLPRGNLIEDDL